MSALRAVIFDVDGTLAETERDGHRPAFNRAFAELRLPYRWGIAEYGELLAVTGGRRRLRGYLERAGHPGSAEELDELATRLHRAKTTAFVDWVLRGPVTARPGVQRLVADLVGSGVQVAVATTGTRAWVEPLLVRVLPGLHFATIVTGDDVEQLKPHPEAYRTALSALGLDPAEALAIEDSPPGVQSALAAGLGCVTVPSAYTVGADFPTGALATVPDVEHVSAAELRALLRRRGVRAGDRCA